MSFFFSGHRRKFIQMGLAVCAATVASPSFAAIRRASSSKTLSFHNLHTDERLRVDYWKNGKYDRQGMSSINHILRDHYSGDVHAIDPRLMDLLHDVQFRLENPGTIEVISGYRSPKTNLMLASLSDGVAKQSYHLKGMAIDLRLPGTSLPYLYKTALAMRRGGAGFYPDSQFVHLDVGPTRHWS